MSDLAQPSQSSGGRRRRRIWWVLLLVGVLAGAWVWWWGSWRKWDVTITFLRFEGAGDERAAPTSRDGASFAVFEIVNRSGESLLRPKLPVHFRYQLLSPDGRTTNYPGKPPGGWFEMRPGTSKQVTLPLRCPDGTPVTGPFRVGVEMSGLRGFRRREALDRLPGWALHWIYKVLPRSYSRDSSHVYWSETVTP